MNLNIKKIITILLLLCSTFCTITGFAPLFSFLITRFPSLIFQFSLLGI